MVDVAASQTIDGIYGSSAKNHCISPFVTTFIMKVSSITFDSNFSNTRKSQHEIQDKATTDGLNGNLRNELNTFRKILDDVVCE